MKGFAHLDRHRVNAPATSEGGKVSKEPAGTVKGRLGTFFDSVLSKTTEMLNPDDDI